LWIVCHLEDPGSNLVQAKFLQWLMAFRDPHNTLFLTPVSKLCGETPSQIRAWSLIHSKKCIHMWLTLGTPRRLTSPRRRRGTCSRAGAGWAGGRWLCTSTRTRPSAWRCPPSEWCRGLKPVFNNMRWPPGVNFAPLGNVHPFIHPQGWTLWCLEERRDKHRAFTPPLYPFIHPQGRTL
jgi:hypothetical protein